MTRSHKPYIECSFSKGGIPLIKGHVPLIKGHVPLIKGHVPVIKGDMPFTHSHRFSAMGGNICSICVNICSRHTIALNLWLWAEGTSPFD